MPPKKAATYEIEDGGEEAPVVVKKTKARKPKAVVSAEIEDVDNMLAAQREAKMKEFIQSSIKELQEKHEKEIKEAKEALEEAKRAHQAELDNAKKKAEQEALKLRVNHKKQISNIKLATLW